MRFAHFSDIVGFFRYEGTWSFQKEQEVLSRIQQVSRGDASVRRFDAEELAYVLGSFALEKRFLAWLEMVHAIQKDMWTNDAC